MKRLNFYLVLVLTFSIFSLTLLSGCSGGGEQQTENNGEQTGGQQRGSSGGDGDRPPQAPKGVPVKVVEIQTGPISDGILSTSVVEAEQSVDVYARVTGTVTTIDAEEGDFVKKGGRLCALEDEELSLQESKTRAEMEKLQKDLERTRSLVEEKVATETELNNAQYTYDQARISWMQAKTSLDYTQVVSTIDAIVSERLVRLGQKVTPSDMLYRLFDPQSLVVNVFIPENEYFTKVSDRRNQVSAVITSESLPGKEFLGSIKRVAPVVDPETNTIKVTLNYRDPNRILRPGMYVRVRLIVDTRSEALLVPKTALLFDENRRYVFVVKDGVAERITLDAGYEDASYIEARSGLQEGDRVVYVGQNGLKNGTEVRIVEGPGAGDPPSPESAPEAENDEQTNENEPNA